MNTETKKQEPSQVHISLFPKPTIVRVIRRHPIFWWHIKHVRTVVIEPVQVKGIFTVKYTDARNNTTFINKELAEHYLGKPICTPEYVGQLHAERFRDVFICYICTKCGFVGGKKTETVFHGPFITVVSPINMVVDLPCPQCNKTITVQVNIESNSNQPTKDDCDWG